jgi:hypothetical protein
VEADPPINRGRPRRIGKTGECTESIPPGYGAWHVERVVRVIEGDSEPAKFATSALSKEAVGSGSRRGPYNQGSRVMPAEERALTSSELQEVAKVR